MKQTEQKQESYGLTSTKEKKEPQDNLAYSEGQNEDMIREERDILGTPFKGLKIKTEQGENWYIVYAQVALSPPRPTFQELEVFLVTDMWTVIGAYALTLMERRDAIKEYEKSNQQNQ